MRYSRGKILKVIVKSYKFCMQMIFAFKRWLEAGAQFRRRRALLYFVGQYYVGLNIRF